MYMTKFNQTEADDLIAKAERSIRIVRSLMDGKTIQEITALEGPSVRTLIIYYFKRLTKKANQ